MNHATAISVLSKPLLFGDKQQIAALRFEEQVAELVALAQENGVGDIGCEKCDGSGWVECPHCNNGEECDECDGTGFKTVDEPWAVGFSEEVMREAGKRLKAIWAKRDDDGWNHK